MDSLKTLMDKKQYDLVLKLTENSQDSLALFYRLSAMLATGKSEEANPFNQTWYLDENPY